MNLREKLVFIQNYLKYMDKYKPRIKVIFWIIIWELLKNCIRYNLVESRNIVVYWVKAFINELDGKKIESNI